METESRTTNNSLADRLLEEPYQFGFFQAVRLLSKIYPDRRAIGLDNAPDEEMVRFSTQVSLEFPASELHKFAQSDDDNKVLELVVAFMGLTGPIGVLPTTYTEFLMERNRAKDKSASDFFDLFNHRLISLFYRAWAKHHFLVGYESGEKDLLTQGLFDLIGMSMPGLQNRMSFNDHSLLFYSGLIAQRPHSVSAVNAILSHFFNATVIIEQFIGQWITLDEEDITKIGKKNNRLGQNMILGNRIWDNQAKFRVCIGPLSFKRFCTFLPNGVAYKQLIDLTKYLVGIEYEFEIQPILKADEVPPFTLSSKPNGKLMLGWTTWLTPKDGFKSDVARKLIINKA